MTRNTLAILSGLLVSAALLLGGCGIAESGAVAGAELEQARQAKQTEERIKRQVDAAYQQSTEQLKAAEAASK